MGWTAHKHPPDPLPLHLSSPLVNFFKNPKYILFVLFLTCLSLSSVCIIFSNLLGLFTSISCCLLFPLLSCICLKLHLLGVNYPFCFFQFLPSCFCDTFFFFFMFSVFYISHDVLVFSSSSCLVISTMDFCILFYNVLS